MSQRQGFSRLLWCLSGSGQGSSISGSGSSAGLGAPSQKPWSPDYQVAAVDLRDATDVTLMVYVTGVTSAPTFTVSLDLYDDLGNLFPAVLSAAAITSGPSSKIASAGLHGAIAASYLPLPAWGRVSWTCTGGGVTGAEISLWGR